MVAVSLARGRGPRRGVDPGRARGHDGRQRVVAPHRARQRHCAHPCGHRDGGGVLHRRGMPGCVVLRSPDRPLRPAQSVHPDPRGLLDRDRCDGVRVRAVVFLPHPVLHRLRHRRGIRGDQFSDRRADPSACARSRGSGDQRDILAGISRRSRRRPCPAGHVELPGQHRMAARVRRRRPLRHLRAAGPAQHSGKPALAVHSRTQPGSRADRRRDRSRR